MSARVQRSIPRRYDDGFRAAIATLVTTPPAAAAALYAFLGASSRDTALLLLFIALCTVFSGFFLIYLLWTHRLFSRADPEELARIAAEQHRRGPGLLARALGVGRTEDWAMTAAIGALTVAVVAAVIGTSRDGLLLPVLVLLTAGTAWAAMVYAFALRYLRLHAAGERITFDIEEEPLFIDFVSMSVMVSSVGAMSAGTPRTRAALSTVRVHTFLAFGFNALVIAMIVSLISGFVTAS